MRGPRLQPIALISHPTTPCEAVRRIEAQVLRSAQATLELRYVLEGDIARLLIPAECSPRPADKLWQHTCFEAFVAAPPDEGYYELNFSPSTQWAIYRFSAYRAGISAVDAARAPHVSVRREADRVSLQAVIDLDPLFSLRDGPALRLALSAVVEDEEHRLGYWALAHPPGKPDFHHAAGFALALPALTPSPSGPASAPSPSGAASTPSPSGAASTPSPSGPASPPSPSGPASPPSPSGRGPG